SLMPWSCCEIWLCFRRIRRQICCKNYSQNRAFWTSASESPDFYRQRDSLGKSRVHHFDFVTPSLRSEGITHPCANSEGCRQKKGAGLLLSPFPPSLARCDRSSSPTLLSVW